MTGLILKCPSPNKLNFNTLHINGRSIRTQYAAITHEPFQPRYTGWFTNNSNTNDLDGSRSTMPARDAGELLPVDQRPNPLVRCS